MKIRDIILCENIDGFDFADLGFENETEAQPAAKEYEDFVNLDSGDKFTIGKGKPVFKVIGKPGTMVGSVTKNAVIVGTAERKFYEVRLLDYDTNHIAAFEVLRGGAETSKEPLLGKVGHVRVVN